MVKNKAGIIVTAALVILGVAVLAQAETGRVSQVVYITMTKACGCTLEKCKAGDNAVGQVFQGARQGLLKRLDYSMDKDTARTYLKKYRVTQAPAVLFLDAQGNLLWMAAGDLSAQDMIAKLEQFGG